MDTRNASKKTDGASTTGKSYLFQKVVEGLDVRDAPLLAYDHDFCPALDGLAGCAPCAGDSTCSPPAENELARTAGANADAEPTDRTDGVEVLGAEVRGLTAQENVHETKEDDARADKAATAEIVKAISRDSPNGPVRMYPVPLNHVANPRMVTMFSGETP